jgi:carbonic anhydrase
VEKILQLPNVEVTAVVGKEEELKGELRKAFSKNDGKLEIHGWVYRLTDGLLHDLNFKPHFQP